VGIKIGYLTDIHLRRAVPGTSPIEIRHCRAMPERLPVALDRLRSAAPDIIVCTGDVLDVAEGPGALSDLRFARQLFDDCGVPYLVLPGNHDPFPDAFYEVFPTPQKRLAIEDCELISFYEDACFEGELASRRSEQSLQTMHELLVASGHGPTFTLLLQHYVIYPDHSQGYPHNYQNDADIRRVLEGSKRRLFSISGHIHPGIPLTRHNGVTYFAGRAFCQPPYPFYLIDVAADEILVQELQLEEAEQ
jgi:3',5'-cyclic AMP phosphodiesterase CpdA